MRHSSSEPDASERRFENNYFTEICSGFEAGSYLRLIDFGYHSTLGLRVIKKKQKRREASVRRAPPILDRESERCPPPLLDGQRER